MNYYEILRTIQIIQRSMNNGEKHGRIEPDLKLDIEGELEILTYHIITNVELETIFKSGFTHAKRPEPNDVHIKRPEPKDVHIVSRDTSLCMYDFAEEILKLLEEGENNDNT